MKNWVNPEKNKQQQEILFSRKTKSVNHPQFFLNKFEFRLVLSQKEIINGVNLDNKMFRNEHIAKNMNIAMKIIGPPGKLQFFYHVHLTSLLNPLTP